MRSKCQWYEENEKSTKYFLNLEKQHAEKSTIRRLVTDEKDLVKHNDINNEIFSSDLSFKERIKLISWITTLYYNQSLYLL